MAVPDDSRPRVRLSLNEQLTWLQFVERETHRHPRQLLNFWTARGEIRDPVLDVAFLALWKTPTHDERQQDHG